MTGCTVSARDGYLRLRFRITGEDGTKHRVSRETGKADTAANRKALDRVAKLVGAAIRAGQSLEEIDRMLQIAPRVEKPRPKGPTPTVADFFEEWIESRVASRKAQARKYRSHFDVHVIPALGDFPIGDLVPKDIRGFQAELLSKVKAKTAKNVVSSLRALVRTARVDGLVDRDLFGELEWKRAPRPEPDPFTAAERQKILKAFAAREYGFNPGRGESVQRYRPHPPFFAYAHALFWTGLRPSEASGLQQGDLDLAKRRIYVRRSRNEYEDGAPKTVSAERTVEIFPETCFILAAIRRPGAAPTDPVFTNTRGLHIEPKSFSEHWYDVLGELGLRRRGLYCTKDTYVTTALEAGVAIPWLEQQTGVAYATLRKHYAKWMPSDPEREMRKFTEIDPALFGAVPPENGPENRRSRVHSPESVVPVRAGKCEEGDLNPLHFARLQAVFPDLITKKPPLPARKWTRNGSKKRAAEGGRCG